MEENLFKGIGYDKYCFASHGIEKNFEWYAYANYYDQSLHPSRIEFIKENEKEREIKSIEHNLRDKFYTSINSNQRILNQCTKPLIEYDVTKWVPGGYALACFVDALKNFFDFEKLLGLFNEQSTVQDLYRNRDVIVPMIYADGDALEWLEDAADNYINNLNCKSVIGLFIYRIKPYNNRYPQKSNYPSFTEYDFAGHVNMNSSKDFLSALADGMQEDVNRYKYIGNKNFE